MKKLAWLVRTTKPTDKRLQKDDACAVCDSSMPVSNSTNSIKDRCCACQARICSRCYSIKKLACCLPSKPNALSLVKMRFCSRYMLHAMETSAETAALQEVSDAESGVCSHESSSSFIRDTISSQPPRSFETPFRFSQFVIVAVCPLPRGEVWM